ncbi:MAG: MSMEG_1061 family FMN-dependent PPOX-type flavoprotein [Pseudomonadota bacterium]
MKITDRDRLRALYGEVLPRSLTKELTAFDVHCRQFIAASPFLMISSSGPQGIDVTPRGDAPGFVAVEDDTTLLLPDRPGNARVDTMHNILDDPRVGLIFMIPTVRETLRVRGRAELLVDEALNARFAVKGRPALAVLRIKLDCAYIHCAKSALRSGIWQPETWPSERPVAIMSQMMNDHGALEAPIESDEAMVERYKKMLY